MTTDPTPLQERIARALPDSVGGWNKDTAAIQRSAAAVLPLVAAEVQAAKAAAWDEGCAAAEQYYKRTVIGVPGSDPIPAPLNPHKTGDSDERR